jgi:hypothetical protein
VLHVYDFLAVIFPYIIIGYGVLVGAFVISSLLTD